MAQSRFAPPVDQSQPRVIHLTPAVRLEEERVVLAALRSDRRKLDAEIERQEAKVELLLEGIRDRSLDKLLTTNDLAELLNVSPDHVRHLAQAGALVVTKVGSSARFRQEDVQSFLEKRGSVS